MYNKVVVHMGGGYSFSSLIFVVIIWTQRIESLFNMRIMKI